MGSKRIFICLSYSTERNRKIQGKNRRRIEEETHFCPRFSVKTAKRPPKPSGAVCHGKERGRAARRSTHAAKGCGFIVDIIPPLFRICKKKRKTFKNFRWYSSKSGKTQEFRQKSAVLSGTLARNHADLVWEIAAFRAKKEKIKNLQKALDKLRPLH